MTPEERQMLSDLFERIRGQANGPRDAEAERFIADAVKAQPYAPYLLAQTVLVQQQALGAAADQIKQLQNRIAELDKGEEQQPPSGGSFLGGIGRSIFGGSQPLSQAQRGAVPSYPPPPSYGPPPSYPPQQPGPGPGPWSQGPAPSSGGSFLKGALGAAAGVAGGVLLADSIRNLFSSHSNPMLGNIAGLGPGGGFLGPDPGYYASDTEVMPVDAVPDDVPPDVQDVSDDYGGGDNYSGDDYSGSDVGSGSDDGTIDV